MDERVDLQFEAKIEVEIPRNVSQNLMQQDTDPNPKRHKHYGRVNPKKEKRRLAKERAILLQQQKQEEGGEQEEGVEQGGAFEELGHCYDLASHLKCDNASDKVELTLFASRKLKSFPACIFAHPRLESQLRSLDLSRNEMKELPAEIGKLGALEKLDLSRNFLRRFPEEIGDLKSLVKLNASSNDFRGLGALCLEALSSIAVLRTFDLRRCPRIGQHGSSDVSHLASVLGPTVECFVTQQTVSREEKPHAATRDASLLASQIAPHCTGVLRRRLALVYGDVTDPAEVEREEVIERLVAATVMPRAIRRIRGAKVCDERCKALKVEIDGWVKRDKERRKRPGEVRERTNVDAQHYMILKSPLAFGVADSPAAKRAAEKVRENEEMWGKALELLRSHDSEFANRVTAIAFTANFLGSCHIDTQNTGPFYGLALGDFSDGGALCVEVSAREVAYVDTKNRLGKVDGRFPHWVESYQGTRYSVIFYQTRGDLVKRTTAVFDGEPVVKDDPPTFPARKDSYYNCYDPDTGKYEPEA